jgi:hypothetical protein
VALEGCSPAGAERSKKAEALEYAATHGVSAASDKYDITW